MSQDNNGGVTRIRADYRRAYTNLLDNRNEPMYDNCTDLKMYYDLRTYIEDGEIGPSPETANRRIRIGDETTAAECRRCDRSSNAAGEPKDGNDSRFSRENVWTACDYRREPNDDDDVSERATSKSCRDECATLADVLEKAKRSVGDLLNEIGARDRSAKRYETMCRSYSETLYEQIRIAADKDVEIRELRTDLIRAADELERARDRNALLESDRDRRSRARSAELEERERIAADKDAETRALRRELIELADSNASLNDRLELQERENERLKTEIESLTCTVRDQEDRIRNGETAYAALDATKSAEIASLEDERNSLRNQVAEADERMSLLSEDANALRDRLERAERELCAASESRGCIDEKLRARDAEIERDRKQFADLKSENDALKNSLENQTSPKPSIHVGVQTATCRAEKSCARDAVEIESARKMFLDLKSENDALKNSLENQTSPKPSIHVAVQTAMYRTGSVPNAHETNSLGIDSCCSKQDKEKILRLKKKLNDTLMREKRLENIEDDLKNEIQRKENQLRKQNEVSNTIDLENESNRPVSNGTEIKFFIRQFVFFYDKIMELKKKLVDENGFIVRRNELTERLSEQRKFLEVNGRHPETVIDPGLMGCEGNDLNTKYMELLNSVLEHGRKTLSDLANLLEKGHLDEPEECLEDQTVN